MYISEFKPIDTKPKGMIFFKNLDEIKKLMKTSWQQVVNKLTKKFSEIGKRILSKYKGY